MTAVLLGMLPFVFSCETRVIRQEEMFFMKHSEENWKKLSPRQKAKYYEMVDKQKERGRKEKLRKK